MALFRRVPGDETDPPAGVETVPAPSSRPVSRKPAPAPVSPARKDGPGSVGSTWIGRQARLEGKITTDDDICVQGRLSGSIHSSASVVISEGSEVEADIKARDVTVHGQVRGDVETLGETRIAATGSLAGEITAAAVVIALGAEFEGVIRRRGTKSPPPDKTGS